MGATEVSWLWLLPALPALGSVLNATIGRSTKREGPVSAIAIGAMVGAFGVALFALFALIGDSEKRLTQHLWNVLDTGPVRVEAALAVEPLSILLVLVITGIGALIHVYSTRYMAGDAGYWRYFAALNLFVSAMLVLVLADNLVLMFVGWEGVGFCSWLLIGFHFEDIEKVRAANRAFLVNRLGDVGLIVGMLMLFWSSASTGWTAYQPFATGTGSQLTFEFHALAERLAFVGQPGTDASGWLTIACLLIFVGAAAKSAQLPFHGWLPDAMAGPTPVSALIHAATMVTAGVYLLVRLSFLYMQSPTAMTVVACVGAATAIYAASCALVQTDFKRVLAYSTISQLGFMFLAVGVGAWWAAIFHLVTHAFFKAGLFLAAGAVLHGTHHEQDLRRLGGLQARMPVVGRVYAFTALALAGVPLAGSFFSKDFILHGAYKAGSNLTSSGLGVVLWAVASLAALGTSIYAWRSWTLAFSGTWRGANEAPTTDAPPSMRWVLVVLAGGSLATALLALPAFDNWLDPSLGRAKQAAMTAQAPLSALGSWLMIGFAIAVALGGIWIAAKLWSKGPRQATSPALLMFLHSGWGFDGLYRGIVRATVGFTTKLAAFDRVVVDGMVAAFAAIVRYLCMFEAAFDYYVVDGMVHLVGQISMRTGKSLRSLQSGDLMRYLYVAVAGALIVVCLQYWMR